MILHIFKILILKKEERGNIYIWRKGACERKRTEITMCVKKEQVHRSSSTALCWPKASDSSKKYIYYTLKWSIICNIFLIKRQNTMLLNNHYLGKYIPFLQILTDLECNYVVECLSLSDNASVQQLGCLSRMWDSFWDKLHHTWQQNAGHFCFRWQKYSTGFQIAMER